MAEEVLPLDWLDQTATVTPAAAVNNPNNWDDDSDKPADYVLKNVRIDNTTRYLQTANGGALQGVYLMFIDPVNTQPQGKIPVVEDVITWPEGKAKVVAVSVIHDTPGVNHWEVIMQ